MYNTLAATICHHICHHWRGRLSDSMNPVLQTPIALKTLVIDALEETKAQDIITINVQSISSITDTMIIASGTSQRHVRSLAQNVVKHVKKHGIQPVGVEGQQNTEWVLVDLGDIVIHVMTTASRQFYDLEHLWQTSNTLESAI